MIDTDRLKNLFRLTSIYSAGKIGVAVIGFALYPIYTQFITPEQFGIIGLALLVSGGSRRLFTLGLDAAAFNFYHRYEGREREEFYTTIFAFIFIMSVGWLLLFELFGAELFRLLLGESLYDPYFRIILLATGITSLLHVIPKQRFRAAEKAKWFVSMDAGTTLVNHAASLVAVVAFSLGVIGYLIGNLVGAAIIGIVGLIVILRRAVPRISLSKLQEALRYSIPLFPHFYSHFIISMADRVLLTRLGSLGAVGVYTVGYSLSNSLYLLVTSANSAIMPEFARAGDDDEAFERLPPMATYYLLFAATATSGMVWFMPPFIRAFFPSNYQAAIDLIPWLGLAFFSVALYYVPMNVLSQTQRNTRIVPLLTVIAAGVNIGVNFLLIPRYGIIGAAVSTLAAYLVLASTVFSYSQLATPVPYQYRRTGIVIGTLVASVGMATVLPTLTLGVSLVVRCLLFLAFFVVLTMLGFWSQDEIELILSFGTELRSRI